MKVPMWCGDAENDSIATVDKRVYVLRVYARLVAKRPYSANAITCGHIGDVYI